MNEGDFDDFNNGKLPKRFEYHFTSSVHYIGGKAPNLNAIQKGSGLRNSLIHSFSEKEISAAMLNKHSKEIKNA
ncbi:hypothetical protein MUA02_10650 [Enterobacteriaceae bacterium H20N1]|uniref:Uncharacterized protein n=1 Tax=Dryocola boscaweniae TaxID=2925397 RepID=A0A9X3ACN6_9ENTR|nr:hypothetical protein [Dryocola boscaweniae]MCT4702063.1 hypothetical protein [Dryocola boscaweniae]MCT4719493.1 hypothetical protein [Dryocola boscaweniae]